MASSAPLPPAPDREPDEPEAEEGVDFARVIAMVRFVLRAPRRRPRLSAVVFLVVCLLTAAVALFAPRVYTVSTRILVQRNVVIPLLGNPRRALPTEWDTSMRGTSENLLRRDNLTAIVKETGLEESWDTGRSPALKLVDRIVRAVFGEPSREDRVRALVGMLEKKITVQVDETTITIALSWHDPQVAYQLVSAAERSFFRDRSDTETAAISETIAILEKEAARHREAIDADVADAQSAQAPPRPRSSFAPRRGPLAPLPRGTSVAAELAQKRVAIQAIADPWQRRLVDLRAQLATLRLTYASAHPSVITLEERIRQAAVEPPELAELKGEEAALLAQVKELSGGTGTLGGPPAPIFLARPRESADEAPEQAPAKAGLAAAVKKYEDVLDRIDSARIELNTSRAASKFRLVVIGPAEVPKQPAKPSMSIIVLGGLGLGVVLAIAAATARDLASHRLIEPWQAQRLPIPLLAEVKKP